MIWIIDNKNIISLASDKYFSLSIVRFSRGERQSIRAYRAARARRRNVHVTNRSLSHALALALPLQVWFRTAPSRLLMRWIPSVTCNITTIIQKVKGSPWKPSSTRQTLFCNAWLCVERQRSSPKDSQLELFAELELEISSDETALDSRVLAHRRWRSRLLSLFDWAGCW